jgi:hypothetical protein
MAGVEIWLASPIEWSVRATGTNVNVTASKAAAGIGFRHYIFGVSVSAGAAPIVATEAQLRKDAGSTILDGWLFPPSMFAPLVVNYLTHPMESSDNGDIDCIFPALGAGVAATVVLKGSTRNRG